MAIWWKQEISRQRTQTQHLQSTANTMQNNQLPLSSPLGFSFFPFFFDCTLFRRSWKLAPERDKDAIFLQLPYEKCQVEEIHVQTGDKSFREHPISAGRIYGFFFSFLFFFKVSRIPMNITQSRGRTFCTEWLTAHTHQWGSYSDSKSPVIFSSTFSLNTKF